MKLQPTKYTILSLLLFIFVQQQAFSQLTLSGKIRDKKSGIPLPGVTLYLPDLKTGAATNADGYYVIKNLPKGKFSISIKYLGYTTQNLSLEITGNTSQDFELAEGVVESKEFIVTGVSQATERSRTPTPVALVPKTELLQNTSTNIIDALAKQPGISQLSTGQGISKPVIRGLGYNRVVVVNDGIRQEGQQWGDEHGIELDEYSVNNVEILKGPASLSYGSDALAGVINFISAPSANEGEINANLMSNYQSNNQLFGYSASVNGNSKGRIAELRFSQKYAGNYKNKYDGKVYNSAFNESNVTGMIGLTKKWGFAHIHYGYYNLNIGLPEGERDSSSGKFLKQVAFSDTSIGNEIASNADLNSRIPSTPFQRIKHSKVVLNSNVVIGNGRIGATLGFQQNERQEFGSILEPKQYGLYFLLKSINYDLRYVLPEKNKWNVSIGINGMQQNSKNKGTAYLVPEYNLVDGGLFLIAKKSLNRLDLSGGLRFDTRFENGKALFLDSTGKLSSATDQFSIQKFQHFNRNFSGISGSIGATYQINESVFSKLNISRGFRAPNISELGSNGEHEGTIRYEIGNTNLKPESSLEFDLEFGINKDHLSLEVDLFNNRISNFIFPVKLASVHGGDSLTANFSTFKYTSGNANLMGGELTIDLHPHPFDWLHFENSFSIVQATQLNQPDSTRFLPFTPAPKINSVLRATAKKSGKYLRNAYAKFEVENYFAQQNIYRASSTESETPAYTLLNLGIGSDFVNSKNNLICSIYVSANNLADVAYQNHLSRLKYAPENYASGRQGIFNMGRNFSFKVLIPLVLKKSGN